MAKIIIKQAGYSLKVLDDHFLKLHDIVENIRYYHEKSFKKENDEFNNLDKELEALIDYICEIGE